MVVSRRRTLSIAFALLALGTPVEEAAAADPEAEASVREASNSGARSLGQEYAGLEAVPVGLAFGYGGVPSMSRLQPGGGATFRFGRHRWRYGYLTPAQAGFFYSSQVVLLHAQAEGGLVFPRPLQKLEVGVGAGIGLLDIAYTETGCDGPCKVGGAGPLFSPVVRYLFIDGPQMSMGASVRALIPLTLGRGNWGGISYTGTGQLVLVALDLAFGSGR